MDWQVSNVKWKTDLPEVLYIAANDGIQELLEALSSRFPHVVFKPYVSSSRQMSAEKCAAL